MANVIILKNSSTAGRVPSSTDLQHGELAINYADGKMYFKTSTDTIDFFEASPDYGTVKSVNVSGGVTGLTFTGGPITNSGTLTLSGVLGLESGGTGANTKEGAWVTLFPAHTGNGGKFLSTDGQGNLSWQGLLSSNITSALGYTPVNVAGDTMLGDLILNADPSTALGAATRQYVDRVGTYTAGSGIDITNKVIENTGVLNVNAGQNISVSSSSGTVTVGFTGTLPITSGGTGAATGAEALTALAAPLTPNRVLRSDGVTVSLAKLNIATDVTGILPVQYGGTGQSGFISGYIRSNGTTLSSFPLIPGSDVIGDIPGNSANVTGVVTIAHGGTGQTSFVAGYIKSDGMDLISSPTIDIADITGTVPVSNGGTGATSEQGARTNLLPSQTDKAGFFLKTNGTDVLWEELFLTYGTVTSIDVSGGTTGLTFTGGPVVDSGTITMAGTLSMLNGGTGVTSISPGYVKSTGTVLSSALTIPGADITGDISGNSANVNGIVSLSHGGTGLNVTTVDELLNSILPEQTTSGQLLSTDGNTTSWVDPYVLPTATTTVLGGVKIDGTTITIDPQGVISSSAAYTLPVATTTVLGGVKADGVTVSISETGVLSVVGYSDFGTVKSVDIAGGTTGLTTIGGPVTSTGTITLGGTLAIAHGGTGSTSIAPGYVKSDGSVLIGVESILGTDVAGDILGNAANITGVVTIVHGGTGVTELVAGYIKSNGDQLVSTATIAGSDVSGDIVGNAGNVTGIVAVANGGTGTTNGSITGTGNLTFTAGGLDSNVILAPTGTGSVNVSGKNISNVALPVNGTDAANKEYVDAVTTGLDFKESVRAATISDIILYGEQTIDGIVVSIGDRVLVKNQVDNKQNGIYTVSASDWVRATDADNTPSNEVSGGMFTFVESGTVNSDTGWVLTTNGSVTLDTTPLTFVQFSSAGVVSAGAGLNKAGNILSVDVDNVSLDIVGSEVVVKDAGVSFAKIQDIDGLSVIGRSTDTTGVSSNITASTDYTVLRRSGQALSFGSIDLSQSNTVGSSILSVANGGTGSSTLTGAITALLPDQSSSSGQYLTTNGSTLSWAPVFSGDYNDLTNKPTLFDGKFTSLTDVPTTLSGYGITDDIVVRDNGNITVDSVELVNTQFASSSLTATDTTSDQVIDTVSITMYRTVKYMVQITSGSNYQATELLLLHDGTDVYVTIYGDIFTSANLCSFNADISGENMRLLVTPVNNNTTFKVVRDAIKI
jgi:hypothetical protein